MSQTPFNPDNHHQSPLDDEEARLARLIAQLPGGSPDAQTDARIMAAARTACESPPRRRPLPWGLGGALAAGLALLVYWQAPPPLPEPTTLTQTPEATGPVADVASARQPAAASSGPTESTEDASTPADAQASREAVSAVALTDRAADAGSVSASARSAERQTAAPAAPPVADAVEYDPARLGSQDAKGALEERLARRKARAEAASQADAAEESTADAAKPSESEPQATKPSYRLVQPSPITTPSPEPIPYLPPVESDVELAAEDWLSRIRDRVAHGPQDEAVRSLVLFQQRYPDHPLPEDLSALLR